VIHDCASPDPPPFSFPIRVRRFSLTRQARQEKKKKKRKEKKGTSVSTTTSTLIGTVNLARHKAGLTGGYIDTDTDGTVSRRRPKLWGDF